MEDPQPSILARLTIDLIFLDCREQIVGGLYVGIREAFRIFSAE